MKSIIVAGIGTEVGKTVVSAILTLLFNADYWKPIECGEESDTATLKTWLDTTKHHIYAPAYSLKAPLSPHHAARLENITISLESIWPPQTERFLIIEGVGGIFVPLNDHQTSLELFKTWNCSWVVVSKHYLGSINHTLLTIEALRQQKLSIAGIVFNGEPNEDSEKVILNLSQIPCLGRLFPEPHLHPKTLQKYASLWKPSFR